MTLKTSFKAAQQGATLIIVLFVLLLVTIVGVLAIRVALTSLNIATNSQIGQLLIQTADTPINQFSNVDLSTVVDLSGVIGAAIQDSEVDPGKEYVFCYKPTSNEKFAASLNMTVIRPPAINAGANTKATISQGGGTGFCDLQTDFGSGREAVVTQVAVKIPTDPPADAAPGAYLARGTNVSQGTILPKNVVAQQRIRVTTTAILPAYARSNLTTIQNDCIGSSSAAGYINDNVDTAVSGKKTLADCLSGYSVPVNSQTQEFNLVTMFNQTVAP